MSLLVNHRSYTSLTSRVQDDHPHVSPYRRSPQIPIDTYNLYTYVTPSHKEENPYIGCLKYGYTQFAIRLDKYRYNKYYQGVVFVRVIGRYPLTYIFDTRRSILL